MPFKKGDPNINRKGAPRKPEIDLFRSAIEQVEKEKGLSLMVYAVRKSFESENVLIALLKKILPDKIEDETFKNLCKTFLVFPKNPENPGITDEGKPN